jgi:hypoxanthine phosphoribosyltransferase
MARPFEIPPKTETGEEYNHPEIAEIEPAITVLVEQLKDKIDNQEYDTIISDDVGGRIPAHILRKIIRAKMGTKGRLHTSHVLGGFSIRDEQMQEAVLSLLKKQSQQTKKRALLVTEFTHSGESLKILTDLMSQAGFDFDLAVVYSMGHFPHQVIEEVLPESSQIFLGSEEPPHKGGHLGIHQKSAQLTGIEKDKSSKAPYPALYKKVLPIKGKPLTEEEEQEFLRRYNKFYQERDEEKKEKLRLELLQYTEQRDQAGKKITEQDWEDLKQSIQVTREDVEKMANKILQQVWA